MYKYGSLQGLYRIETIIMFKVFRDKFLLYQALSRLLPQGLNLIINIILVRVSGIVLVGQMTETMALLTMSFGVILTGIQDNYLRSGNISQLKNVLTLYICYFLFFGVIIAPVFSYIFNIDLKIIIGFLTLLFLTGLGDLYGIYLRFLLKDRFLVISKSIPLICIALGIICYRPNNIYELVVIYVVSWIIILLFYIKNKKIITRLNFSLNKTIDLMKRSLLLSATTLATQLYGNVDQFMISKIAGYHASGSYRIALTFSALAMPLVGVFSFMYLSRIGKIIANNNFQLLKRSFYDQLKLNLLIAVLLLMFSYAILPILLPFLYGEEASSAINCAIILSFAMSINIIGMTFSYTFLALKRERYVLLATVMGVFVNLILNLSLIKRFGIEGAAWASVLTQFSILCMLAFGLRRVDYE